MSLPTFGSPSGYARRVIRRFRGSCIRYWPLDDPSSTRARELITGDHGARTGTSTDQGGFLSPVSLFDGINDFVNIYSAALAAEFDGQEGSALIWAQTPAASWTDGLSHALFHLYGPTAGGDELHFHIYSGNNQVYYRFKVDDTIRHMIPSQSSTDWLLWGMTWSLVGDRVRTYFNGVASSNAAMPGTWDTVINKALIGAQDTGGADPWSGYAAHCSLYNRALSADEIVWIYKEAYG